MADFSFASDVADDDLKAERDAVQALRTLHGIKEGRKEFEKAEKEARVPVDNWFLSHPDERELRDPELGYVAKLQSGGSSMVYERARLISEGAPQLYARLVQLDCVSIDGDKVRDAIKEGLLVPADIDRWRHPVERSQRLLVEKSDG